MQFRPPPPPQVRDEHPVRRPSRSDRDCPLDTARDRCLRHASGTAVDDGEAQLGDDCTGLRAGEIRPQWPPASLASRRSWRSPKQTLPS
jgi:hypothetical protein